MDDKAMILDPDFWPMWPFLPLKRSREGGSWPEMGFMFEGKFTIYILNMFSLSDLGEKERKEALASCIKHEYATVDDLLKEGWYID